MRGAGLSSGLYRWLVFAISLQRTAQAERSPYEAYSGAGSRCCAVPSGMQTARSPYHLIDDGAHAVAVGLLHQGALGVECAVGLAQRKGLGCEPAFQVDEQGCQVAL